MHPTPLFYQKTSESLIPLTLEELLLMARENRRDQFAANLAWTRAPWRTKAKRQAHVKRQALLAVQHCIRKELVRRGMQEATARMLFIFTRYDS